MNWFARQRHEHPLLLGSVVGIAGCGFVAAAVAAFLILGGFNTAADSPHFEVAAWAAHTTMENSVKLRARERKSPSRVSSAMLLTGAREYDEHCVECHGGPGTARAKWARAMLPTPPYLLGAGAEWSHGELYTVIDHGVKMTAMPAWGEVEPPEKIAALTDFVELLPRLSPSEFERLRQVARASEASEESE